MSKVIFVGNVPYKMGEECLFSEQLIDVFKSVGQVVGFRLVFDRDTGKPKGFGFCEFADHETALSAVRNLNNQDVGGRPLRIDLADSDPFLEGKTTVHGELVDVGEVRSLWRDDSDKQRSHGGSKDLDFLVHLPPGTPVPPGSTVLDAISTTLATMPPSQLIEVLAQMKAFIITHPEQARALLVAHPQLAHALFQALLLNRIVDPAILQRMLNATPRATAGPTPAAPVPQPPPQISYQQPPSVLQQPQPVMPPPQAMSVPPPNMYAQAPPPHIPQQPSYYRAPPPPQSIPPPSVPHQPVPQQQPTPDLGMDANQRQMLMQVLSLTPDQINALPPSERDAIQQLRNQFMGTLAA